jgi:NADH dehydrogenase [ubiquinone] 1 alpha subcomplex assembly factor 7
MGMHIRVEALKRATNTEERRGAIDTAARRLVDTLGMGKEYQVLGITSHDRSEGDAAEAEGVWPFLDIKDDSGPNEWF